MSCDTNKIDAIPKRIDAILQKRGMSRRQIALKAGIPPTSFQAAMTRGRNITLDMIQSIAQALDITMASLLGQDEIKELTPLELDAFAQELVDEFRAAASTDKLTLGQLVALNADEQVEIDCREEELNRIKYQQEWAEHDPYEDRTEIFELKYIELNKRQVQAVLNSLLKTMGLYFSVPSHLMQETTDDAAWKDAISKHIASQDSDTASRMDKYIWMMAYYSNYSRHPGINCRGKISEQSGLERRYEIIRTSVYNVVKEMVKPIEDINSPLMSEFLSDFMTLTLENRQKVIDYINLLILSQNHH